MTELGVVIPVYNAAHSIVAVAEGVLTHFKMLGISGRLVLVDDKSTDESALLLLGLAEAHPSITALLLEKNQGQQSALMHGLPLLTDCTYCITMDDDLQHPAELIGALYEKIGQGWELVYAVPQGESRPLVRRLGSLMRDLFFVLFIRKPWGVRVSSYRIMTGALVNKILSETRGYVYLSASAFQYAPKTACIPYHPLPRLYGASGYNLKKLMVVYGKLFLHYTPLGKLFHRAIHLFPVNPPISSKGGSLFEQADDPGRIKLPEKCPFSRKAFGASDNSRRLLRKSPRSRSGGHPYTREHL